MKEALRRGLIGFVLFMILVSPVWAGNKPEPRLITVTGEAEVRVPPDEVILNLGVETWDKDLALATRENDERVKGIFALAKKYNVAPGDMRIENISIEPRYKDGEAREDFIGYCVRKTIVLTVRKVSKFEDLLSGALEAGANYVYGAQFRTAKLREYRAQARILALRAAKEKAKNMAKELGQKVGRPYTIVEEQYERGMAPNVIQGAGGSPGEADKSIAMGQISVSARVRVSFELR